MFSGDMNQGFNFEEWRWNDSSRYSPFDLPVAPITSPTSKRDVNAPALIQPNHNWTPMDTTPGVDPFALGYVTPEFMGVQGPYHQTEGPLLPILLPDVTKPPPPFMTSAPPTRACNSHMLQDFIVMACGYG